MRLMESLGVVPDVVDVVTVPKWQDVARPDNYTIYDTPVDAPHYDESPFTISTSLNRKIAIWSGDISVLQVDAVVNPTNETMDERRRVCQRILARAGPGLSMAIKNEIKECRTGDLKVSQAYNLPARYIIHTVGPWYNKNYETAAQNTLYGCYRNVLQKSRELGLRTIALPVINTAIRNYPPDGGAHIALRTIRRFLENYNNSLSLIILVLEPSDWGVYQVLLPFYFPRTLEEQSVACLRLPDDIGGPDGEPLQPDRQIRIIDNPQHALEATPEVIVDLYMKKRKKTSVDLKADESVETTLRKGGDDDDYDGKMRLSEGQFTKMQGDLDQQKLLGDKPTCDPLTEIMIRQMQHKERYERLLRRAKTEDLSEVSGIGCLYQSGVDRMGRPVVVFAGKWFPALTINLDKALLYLIQLLDPIVKGDYVIAYFHAQTASTNYPSLSWLREVYNVLPYEYKKNLKHLYIVHPTWWTKMMTWWFTTFMAPAIKEKVHNLPGVEYLYEIMSPEQLEIPAYITEYDMTINGIRYFQPEPSSPTYT